jgi:hypothetical protein
MIDGFPMQASLSGTPMKIEQIEDGASTRVNGHTLEGPGAVWREATINEVSMCVFGALQNTQSTAFADPDNQQIEFELLGKDTPMSEKEKAALTLETFKADHGDLYNQIVASAKADAVKAEQTRFASMKSACGEDVALAAECFAAGLTVPDALTKRNEKLASQLKAANELLAKAATVAADPVARATAEFKAQPAPQTEMEKAAKFDEAKATDAELEAHFAATAALRDQFSSAKAYVAHVRHPARV